MRLCMFHPVNHPMERGWVGRIDDDRVVHLAAQTLQSFFTGGGSAREHAEYRLADARFLAPVLHPPAVRVFDGQGSFAFANPAAILGPAAAVPSPSNLRLTLIPRLAGVIGADGALSGFTVFVDWRDPSRDAPKDRDFALGLGPVVVTVDDLRPEDVEATVRVDGSRLLRARADGFDWTAAVAHAADRTTLKPGDLVAGPGLGAVEGVVPGSVAEIELAGIGVLEQSVVGA